MKTCTRCGIEQPLINFHKRLKSPDGLAGACRICVGRDKKEQRARLRARSEEEIEAAAAARPPRACRACEVVKTFDQYPRDRGRHDGRGTMCLGCAALAQKQFRVARPEVYRARKRADVGDNRRRNRRQQLKYQFGITPEAYAEMHAAQNGLCALCGKPETATRNGKVKCLAVDHCHGSLVVRGLLCANCNHGLGHFKDNPDVLRAAAEYLERHQAV